MTFGQSHSIAWLLEFIGIEVDCPAISQTTIATGNYTFQLFPFKSVWDQIWPCYKIIQDQPNVTIYISFEVRESQIQMIHAKFPINQPSDSGNFFFFLIFIIYRSECHLRHVTWTKIYKTFLPPFPFRVHMKFNWNWPCSSKEGVKRRWTNELLLRSLNDLDQKL